MGKTLAKTHFMSHFNDTWHPILYPQGINNLVTEICLRIQTCNSGTKRECEYKRSVVYQGLGTRLLRLKESLVSEKALRKEAGLIQFFLKIR